MSIYLYLVKTKIPTYFLKRSCGVQSLLSPPPKSHGVRKVLLGLRPNPRQGAIPLESTIDLTFCKPRTDNIRFL